MAEHLKNVWAIEEHRDRVLKRLIAAIVIVLAILLLLLYVVSVMNNMFGSFTISVNKYQQLTYGLSLSETADFANPTAKLNCRASELITNIDGSSLDMNQLGVNDGVDSGTNYLCYTFYCKNTGREMLSVEQSINIANMTMGVEKAVRVRVMTSLNGAPRTVVDYARANRVDDDGTVVPEPGTTPFYSTNVVMFGHIDNFMPEDIIKYTIVIWLEGPDPDCVDDILGGEFKLDFKFQVTAHSEVIDVETETGSETETASDAE